MLAKFTVLFLAAASAHAQFTAAATSLFAVGAGPRSIAGGDFNGDGKLDFATANSGGNSVSVLLGNGSGGFTGAPGSPYPVGTSPQSIAAGDFNGDGKIDLVTANSADNTVTLLLGNGAGHFTPAPGGPISVGSSPAWVAAADFNGDGIADLIAANSGDNTLTVLLGQGSGVFAPSAGSPIQVGASPQAVATGDFNRDGNVDIVAVNNADNSLSILLGDGAGGFTAAAGSPVSVGTSPRAVALADVNGDGFLDVLAANSGDNTLSELLGDGTGAFTSAPASPLAVGSKPYSVAVGDFNGDGAPDLAIANFNGNNLTLLLGNGIGSFTAAATSPFATGGSPAFVLSGDCNGDGKPDLIAPNQSGGSVTVLLNVLPAITVNPSSVTFFAGAGHAAAAAIPVAVSSPVPSSTYTASSNKPWLVPSPASNATGGTTTVRLSASGTSLLPGTYSAMVRYKSPNMFGATTAVTFQVSAPSGTLQPSAGGPFAAGVSPQSIAAGDLDGDGKPDLVIANYGANSVTVFLGDGTGGFTEAAGSPLTAGTNPSVVALGDFNGDGRLDIAAANSSDNTVTLLLGSGTGQFTVSAVGPFAVGQNPSGLVVADINGDGKPDILTANNGSQNVSVLLGNGLGVFTAGPGGPVAIGASPVALAAGDFNGDGKLDLVTVNSGNFGSVLLGNGSGGFTLSGTFSAGSFPQSVTAADLNGDGKLDLVISNSGSNTVTVFLGNGSGSFTPAAGSPFPVGTSPQFAAVGDLNGDGKPDIVTANVVDNTLTVLLGNGSGGFASAPGSPFPAGTNPSSLGVGDFNGDGREDFAVADTGAGSVMVLLGSPAVTSSALSTSTVSPVAHGAAVPMSLTVTQPSGSFSSAPTGTVTFMEGTTVLGTAAQTSSPYTFSISSLSGGTHTLTATYHGDPVNAASTSNPITVTVLPQSQTIAFGALSSKVFGTAPFLIAATASSGLPVAFASITAGVCNVAGSTVTLAGAGTCTIQASQAGNTAFAAAVPISQSFPVTPAVQTISFGALSNTMNGSAPFVVSATASSGLAVSFASATLPVCTVSGATVTLVAVGTCTIKATQSGDTNDLPAAAVSQSFSVTPSGQTIVFSALPSQPFGTAPFPVAATASSGLPVTWASTTLPVCTVAGSTVTLVAAGTCTIKASQAGNTNFAAAAPVSQSFTVTPGSQTIAFAGPPDKVYGIGPFPVSATATSALAVSFISLTPAVCTISAGTVTLVSVGTCTLEASQAGNGNYSAAAAVDRSFAVAQATQTITFGALQNKPFGSAPFVLTATASSGLTVAFLAGNSAICTVSGTTVTLLIAGTCIIQASQPGDQNHAVAPLVNQSFQVTQASQTIKFAAIPNQPFGAAPFPLSATASSNYAVSFTTGDATVCSVAGSTLTIMGAGACNVQASQAGDNNIAPAAPVSQRFTVTQGSQTITFGALPNQPLGTAPFSLNATATSGLPVDFTSVATSVCTVAGSTVTLVSVGTCTVKASQAGNANYAAAAPVSQTFAIGLGTVSIGSVSNAGSYTTTQVAAQSYAVAFGSNFATGTAQATSTTLPTKLAGVTATITDSTGLTATAPLYFVSPGQINFLVPAGLAPGNATVTVSNAAGNVGLFTTTIQKVAPSLFTADASGSGPPAASALVYASSASPRVLPVASCKGSPVVCTPAPIDLGPASTSVYLELFGTGIRGRSNLSAVTATLGGTPLKISYASAQGTYAGLDQVNVLIDRSLAGQGTMTLQLTADGIAANPVVVNIK